MSGWHDCIVSENRLRTSVLELEAGLYRYMAEKNMLSLDSDVTVLKIAGLRYSIKKYLEPAI